ncbi:MAG: penicillin-binding protein 1C [candidate division KSB1 bacterium]|nr:penicillin-binding protein 1C [candidate division KSB1 bacterium]
MQLARPLKWLHWLLFSGLFFLVLSTFFPIPASRLTFQEMQSVRIEDRRGELLRELLSPRQGYGRWRSLQEISPDFIIAILAAEDHRFFLHRGVRLRAIARAAWQNLRAGRIVSGGSTITQQLVRQIYPIQPTVFSKLQEIWLALRLEHTLSKVEILEQYINRVPFGNLNYGIDAAARFYFGRPPAHLSLAQASFLAALPQAPSRLNPLRHFKAAQQRQQRILRAMRKLGWIDSLAHAEALSMPIRLAVSRQALQAPHVVTLVAQKLETWPAVALPSRIALHLDDHLQRTLQLILQQELKPLRAYGAGNAAAVVIHNPTGQIRAWVGSADFFDAEHAGQIDGVRMRRQPGSALKPFTYLLALQNGFTAATLLPDLRLDANTPAGDYAPRNYDGRYHGPVRLRTALACSYNIPAVYLAQRMGTDYLLQFLRNAGFHSLEHEAAFYGPGLTLGNGEVSLLELTRAYSGLARGGELPQLRLVQFGDPLLNEAWRRGGRFADERHAALIAHILADPQARLPAFGDDSVLNLPFPCSVKTGTTKNYRDSWTVGFTSEYTAAVWVGNFDGRDMQGISGIAGAAPIFRDIMLHLHRERDPGTLPIPDGLVERPICPLSGKKPRPLCPSRKMEIFVEGTEPREWCDFHYMLSHPETGEPFVAVVYPPEYQAWAGENGIPQPQFVRALAQIELATLQPVSAVTAGLRIRFPDQGDIFKLDPTLPPAYQRIKLQARAPETVSQLEWYLDGRLIGRSSRPFFLFWQLIPGRHELQVRAGELRSPTVEFRVLP